AFFVFSRYRLPAVPGLLLLAAVPVARAAEVFSKGRKRQGAAMFAGIALLWLAPHVHGYAPRIDLVEFNLGRLAEERGDRAAAEVHYEHTLTADPNNLSATLNLGTIAARAGDYAAARVRFELAVALAPDSDDAHANLGGELLALDDLPAAERELTRALELNPENRFAQHNLEILRRRRAVSAR
ncbi:MAG: tetratricopeptide repeat protein, partial [Thermoanaerobaculia bacterium]